MADREQPVGQEPGREPDVPLADERTWLERFEATEQPRPPAPWLVPGLTLAAGAVCSVVGGLAAGPTGVAAGLVAAVLVLAFFAAGALPMALTGREGDSTGMGLVVLLTNYAFRLGAALLVLAVAIGAGAVDRRGVGLSVIACGLVRVNVQVVLLRRVTGT